MSIPLENKCIKASITRWNIVLRVKNARNNTICAALFCHYDSLFIFNKTCYFSTGPLLCLVHRTGSTQQVRCLFNISFYRHLKACSSLFYLQRVAQTLLRVQNVTSPHRFYCHNHPYSHILVLLPTESWFPSGQIQHQRLGTSSFLEEAGGTELQQTCGQLERQAWIPQAAEENEETSLDSYTPPPALDRSSRDSYLAWHSLTPARAMCAAGLLEQGVPHFGGTPGASQTPQKQAAVPHTHRNKTGDS